MNGLVFPSDFLTNWEPFKALSRNVQCANHGVFLSSLLTASPYGYGAAVIAGDWSIPPVWKEETHPYPLGPSLKRP